MTGGSSPFEAWKSETASEADGSAPEGKGLLDTVCALAPDRALLELAKDVEMPAGGMGQEHLSNFLSASGRMLHVPLSSVLSSDVGMRTTVLRGVVKQIEQQLAAGVRGNDLHGVVFVRQDDYSVRDHKLALGGTSIVFQVDGSAEARAQNEATGTVRVTLQLADRYFFSPDDASRATQCLHQAATRLVREGAAAEFDQVGITSIQLPLRDQDVFVASSDDAFSGVSGLVCGEDPGLQGR